MGHGSEPAVLRSSAPKDPATQTEDPANTQQPEYSEYNDDLATILKRAGVNHLIFTQEVDAYAKYIDRENLVDISWGQLSLDYPDDLPSYHTSAEGHRVARDTVMDKLKQNGWI